MKLKLLITELRKISQITLFHQSLQRQDTHQNVLSSVSFHISSKMSLNCCKEGKQSYQADRD